MGVQSKGRQAVSAGSRATAPLQFERHEVGGLLSVAHLFPRTSGRTGIYVLHFQDGEWPRSAKALTWSVDGLTIAVDGTTSPASTSAVFRARTSTPQKRN